MKHSILNLGIFLILVIVGLSCTKSQPKKSKYNSDSIDLIYTADELVTLVDVMRAVDSIFEKINSKGVVPIAQLGFTVSKGKLFFMHCYGDRGAYKDLNECDLDSLIAAPELENLKVLVAFLNSKGIVAGSYRPRLNRMTFNLDYVYRGQEDIRLICVRWPGDEAIIKGSEIRILDWKGEVLLLAKWRH